ncbi:MULTISPECIES: DUF2188 domain-containing protein [unclassified Devosia]|uniref:DUF2188 domain-containing protein n=1 Tax=unclassified Devosia TaxID=196773 RepID=UPI0025FABC09|nr:DUF2188 domain-containing protein [Devosia sp.]MCR6633829.1 DUF2188 domain-containing protein [Devosia sp.]
MSESHFIVYLRDGCWQHTNRGSVSAPFKTREAAIESAIDDARNSSDQNAEVIVQEPETTAETVWRSADDTVD